MTQVDLADLAGWKELSDILHVHRRIILGWAQRRTTTDTYHKNTGITGTNFPQPVLTAAGLPELSMGPMYSKREVVTWWMSWPAQWMAVRGMKKPGYVDPQTLHDLGIEPFEPVGANNGQPHQN